MSGGQKSTTTSVQELSPEQQELLSFVIPEARKISRNEPELYPGSQIAGFDPLQTTGQRQAVKAATGTIAPLAESTAGAHRTLQGSTIPIGTAGAANLVQGLNTAQPAQNFLLSGAALSPDSNPYLARTAEAALTPLTQALTEEALPAIRYGADESGQFGSSRQGIAEGRALDAYTRTAGDVTSGIYSDAYQQGLASMVQALGQTLGAGASGTGQALESGARSLFAAPTVADLALTAPTVLESVGAQRRGMEQALLSEEASRYVTEQIVPFLVAQEVANLAFGTPGGSVTSQAQGPGTDPMQALLGLGGLALGSFFGAPQLGGGIGATLGGLF